MQNNLKHIFNLFESSGDSDPDHSDIMQIFSVSRIVKEKMINGND